VSDIPNTLKTDERVDIPNDGDDLGKKSRFISLPNVPKAGKV